MMKRLGITSIILIFYITSTYADSFRFVTEAMEVTLRTGPGTDHRVIAMVSSGEKIEIVEPGTNWSEVRLEGGKVGYMLNRFITATPPCNITLEKLQKKHQILLEQSAEPLKEVDRLTSENEQLQTNFAAIEHSLNNLQIEHETLKKESKDFLNIKTKYDKTSKQLAEQSARVEKLETEIARLEWNQNIRWFLGGAGVLLLGYIIGFFSKRRRRRPSLL